jgi:hypothetical protein
LRILERFAVSNQDEKPIRIAEFSLGTRESFTARRGRKIVAVWRNARGRERESNLSKIEAGQIHFIDMRAKDFPVKDFPA